MVGDEASRLRSYLQITYPFENGMVRSWEDAYNVWDYTFYERLKVSGSACCFEVAQCTHPVRRSIPRTRRSC